MANLFKWGGGVIGGAENPETPYTFLEYIQSTGTQYIDTGYVFTSQNIRVTLGFEFIGDFSGASLYGSYSTSANAFNIATYGSPHSFYVGTSSGILPLNLSQKTRYSLDVHANNGSLTVDLNGSVSSGSYAGSLDNTLSFPLFAYNYGGFIKQFVSAKYYSCQIYDNGTLVRDFVPCINLNRTYGLYDKLNRKFYQNKGTGLFVPGPVL